MTGVRITDTTLRDGSHAMRHRFTEKDVRQVVRALDGAGVQVIEVTHGDGLAGSSFNYGFSAVPDVRLIEAAASEARSAKIAALVLPGLGTVHDMKEAASAGVQIMRVATHSTEADVSVQHFGAARDLGLETVGFLMLSHMTSPLELARQARIMADAGCQCVYVVDSAGALLPESAAERVAALVDELGDDAEVGFHGHQNLSLGVANSLAAHAVGARQLDGTLRALGAGAGNTPTEVLVAALDAAGVDTGIELPGILAAAEDVLAAIAPQIPAIGRDAVIQGRYGVYNSFLLHAKRAEERYGVPAHAILQAVGEAHYVGGQEDMIIDVAIRLRDEGVA
ncbi:4-hydroxy-2-oxovalerate aldolase [Herbiconiux sp. KACC 21604]|uniref:4-hydroxy-2-oxovalerate aldolase n=1 Tax=unclassified Herbiconiux TaxID=2618217 RepID=UPI001492DA61|nr:4-hydroxy-2-oxovalerate aldolase [Herbiconiux sp. SALV-R1]QJU55315.1 4-hydroxy-2-oxovalerate aldolase [Herbiconiux sp. SALV-R1]WPO86483.1 4-hydroxy-2-oxovalerate aldolase [Herbiconiux sp. KACC 21604]